MFFHHASDAQDPLNRLLRKDAPLEKFPEQLEAFNMIKKLATEASVLAFYTPRRRIRVECDASGRATWGVVWQEQEILASGAI